MGVVFKARDPLIGRLVALKTITAGFASTADLLKRFYREAQAAGALQHPNIVTVYEMGEVEGTPYIAMEYLEGESLEQIIARRPPAPIGQRLGWLVQICRALEYAHSRGVIHRDIKPANIVVTADGTIKIVDFGIARLVDATKTQTGTLLGTLGYMSPQQLRGQKADERSDVWATGVLAYELLTYQKAFSGENHAALLLSIISDEPRPITELNPECPPNLLGFVEHALRKEQTERFQTMSEMLRALEPIWQRHSTGNETRFVPRGHEVENQLESVVSLLEEGRFQTAERLLLELQMKAPEDARVAALLGAARERRAATMVPEPAGAGSSFEYVYAHGAPVPEAGAESPVGARAAVVNRSAGRPASGSGPVLQPTMATRPSERSSIQHAPTLAVHASNRPLWRRPLPVAVAMLVLALGVGGVAARKHLIRPGPPKGGSAAPVPAAVISASPSLEEQQRSLIAQAHQAADRNDYAAAQAKLDQGEQLNGPLGGLIQDLRKRFSQEEQNANTRGVVQQDRVVAQRGPRRAAAQTLESEIRSQPAGNKPQASPSQAFPRDSGATQALAAQQAKFDQLELAYKQAVQRADDSAVQQLREIQPQFRALADLGGPTAQSAHNYADNLIPDALREMANRTAKAAADAAETSQFNAAVDRYSKAVEAKDAAALKSAILPEFQRIAQAGGRKATEANQYVRSTIPVALRNLTPWPAIGCPASPAGMAPSIRPGDLVACGLLDAPKLHWTRFSWPEFPARALQAGQQRGTAMLSVTVNENGDVVDVKPRGTPDAYGFFDTAAAAVRQWKTSLPRVQGKPVRTEFSVDVPFTP